LKSKQLQEEVQNLHTDFQIFLDSYTPT